MAEEVKADYNCTQQELYSVGETIYQNAKNNIAALAAYKAKYTLLYIDGLIANLTTAKNLPDEEARNEAFEELRIELLPLGEKCRDNFIDLKGYINDGWAEDQHENKYEAAGQTKFEADAENWEELVGLNTAMKNFIANNLATLTGPGNMPAGFQAQVTADSDAFDLKYLAFKNARQTAEGTAEKITANNGVNTDIAGVCDDGQRKFKNDAEKKKLFTFSVVKNLVSPPGVSSLKVTVKLNADNTPAAGATVTIQKPGEVARVQQTGADGVTLFADADTGVYNGRVELAGHPAKTFTKDVNTGTQARLNVGLD